MTTDFRALCAELVQIADALDGKSPSVANQGQSLDGFAALANFRQVAARARDALAQPEPGSKRRYIYNPAQIAECGGPCQQGPDHCDCGELWITEPELESHQ